MLLNKFDPLTREFTAVIEAPLNPKQPDKYLAVLNATADPLPRLVEYQVALRSIDNTAWEIIDDYRGKAWNKETKEQVDVSILGPLDEALTKLEPIDFCVWGGGQWDIDQEAQLLSAKVSVKQKVTAFSNKCRRQIAGDVDHLETAEWSEKRLRSLRITNDKALPGDEGKIEMEALYRAKNETVEELAEKILYKAERYENASIIITGMTAAAFDAIDNASTVEGIDVLLVTFKDKSDVELAKL
jgi:hypothetical protein